jgi:hypothetical protein
LQAMVMACPDDDDGEAAMGRNTPQKPAEASKPAQKVETPKAKASKPTEPAKDTEERISFNGESHQQLFQKLMAEGITQDDFMAALRHAGTIPANATDFFLMKEATAQRFLGELTQTIGVVREWIERHKK